MVQNLVVDVTMTNGGVMSIGRGSNIVISSSAFTNIQTAKIGGAFYFVNVSSNIVLLRCNFASVSGNEDGGAVSFGANTTFLINQTNFTNCSTINGRGGALAISSTKEGSRQFYSCSFDQNVAHHTAVLDVFDSSNNAYLYYTTTTVVGTNSSSTSVGDYILFAATQV